MKAITLWEPWATLIAIGAKKYETRHWQTKYRGDIVIHASKKRDREVMNDLQSIGHDLFRLGIQLPPLQFGVGLCVARLEDCIPTELIDEDEQVFGNFAPGRYAWLMTDIRPFEEPIPCKGEQGLWQWKLPIDLKKTTTINEADMRGSDEMSAGERIPLAQAKALCVELIAALDYDGRIDIAGSVRRGKADVGDIELVIHVADPEGDGDFEYQLHRCLSDETIQKRLRADGKVQGWGERFKAATFKGANVDLWLVREDRNYATTLLIRTGDGDFNKRIVTRKEAGGLLPDHLRFHEGDLWMLAFPTPVPESTDKLPPGSRKVMGNEEELFWAMGLEYIAPKDRHINNPFKPCYLLPDFQIAGDVREANYLSLLHKLTLHTARINTTDGDAIDITIDGAEKGRGGWIGALFAPTWAMVNASKATGDTEVYTRNYLDLMRWRYARYAGFYLQLLGRDRVVFTCFCTPDKFCHRHLAVEVMAKIARKQGVTVVEGGELETKPAVVEVVQPTLFDVPVPPKMPRYE